MGSGASAKADADEALTKTNNFIGRSLEEQQRVVVDGFRVPVSLVRCRDEMFEMGVDKADVFKQPASAVEVGGRLHRLHPHPSTAFSPTRSL